MHASAILLLSILAFVCSSWSSAARATTSRGQAAASLGRSLSLTGGFTNSDKPSIQENKSIDEEYATILKNVKANIPPGSTIVIKYGGHAMENEQLRQGFCEDIGALCRLGIIPIIVHGGGPQIEKMLKSLGVKSKFLSGLRVTDQQTMDVAQMVLCGSINKDIVKSISNQPGVRGALGLSGLDCNLIRAKVIEKSVTDPATGLKTVLDLGLVGEPIEVNDKVVKDIINLGLVPVIAPVGSGDGAISLNINADTSAGAIAEALKADRLLLLTDIVGVLDKNKNLIPQIKSTSLASLVADGTITGGMIPKLETAATSVLRGVKAVSIMDGRERHSVLRALSGQRFGTQIIH